MENWHYILVEPPPHQSIMEKPLKRSIFSKREIYCKVWKFSPYQALKSGETIRNLIPPMEMISGRLSKRVKFNQMLTIFPNVANKGILACLQVLHNVLIEWVHVLHQPLGRRVVDLWEMKYMKCNLSHERLTCPA